MSTACYLGKTGKSGSFSHTDITDHRKQNLNATKLLSQRLKIIMLKRRINSSTKWP